MTLQFLRLITVGTIAAAIVSALTLAVIGSDAENRSISSPSVAGAQSAPCRLPAEPTAAGVAPSASGAAR